MRTLGLHQITAMSAAPVELVSIAAEVGCQQVCVFTHVPTAGLPDTEIPMSFPLVTREDVRALQDRLRDCGVGVGNIEFFPVTSAGDIEKYREGFEIGAAIGARRAVTHIHDADDARAIDTLGRLCDLAAEYDLRLGLEFMGLTPACSSLGRAVWFVAQVGRANIGVGVDALHLARTGGTAADISALPAHCFTYGQICDGVGLHLASDYLPEAMDRLLPGDGNWPLVDIISALPVGTSLDVEVPSPSRLSQGISALQHAREAVERARNCIDLARPVR